MTLKWKIIMNGKLKIKSMKAEERFKVGALVRLKSCGPVMTISFIKDYEENRCICF